MGEWRERQAKDPDLALLRQWKGQQQTRPEVGSCPPDGTRNSMSSWLRSAKNIRSGPGQEQIRGTRPGADPRDQAGADQRDQARSKCAGPGRWGSAGPGQEQIRGTRPVQIRGTRPVRISGTRPVRISGTRPGAEQRDQAGADQRYQAGADHRDQARSGAAGPGPERISRNQSAGAGDPETPRQAKTPNRGPRPAGGGGHAQSSRDRLWSIVLAPDFNLLF
uniref:Uncharacterized protein n=1 Tax=Knipowitschia caucasica TaxID=637954 RepID=A0AAV2MDF7_KNICA